MADIQIITNILNGTDRFNNPYVKHIRYTSYGDMIRHTNELGSLFMSLCENSENASAYHAGAGLNKDEESENASATQPRVGPNNDEDRAAFRAKSVAILCRVARHTREWGVARLPINIREPVHELEDAIERNRTDFGPVVGVTQGAPYNGTGY